MSEEARRVWADRWVTLMAFSALFYLRQSFWQAAVVAIFIIVCLMLNTARRLLTMATLLLTILALGVMLGAPHPSEWNTLIRAMYCLRIEAPPIHNDLGFLPVPHDASSLISLRAGQ